MLNSQFSSSKNPCVGLSHTGDSNALGKVSLMKKNGTILLIEDDLEIHRRIDALCRNELNAELTMESDGKRGLELALSGKFELVLVDANLPSMSGFDICREIRSKFPHLGIIFLTGRSDEVDKVVALELGADDYITKPFGLKEVGARIRAVLRRTKNSPEGEQPTFLTFAHLEIDTRSRRVWKNKELVQLTLVEFELLLLFITNPGRTFDRSELLELALGYSTSTHDEALTVHLSRLRSKIEMNPGRPLLIRTIRGIGYRFAAEDEMPDGLA